MVQLPVEHQILWRRLDLPGRDRCQVYASSAGWELRGAAIFQFEQLPCQLDYEVAVDAAWQTRAARVFGVMGDTAIALRVSADSSHRWRMNDIAVPAVTGCIDLDLGFTPATNLIAIRRMALAIGEQAQAPAAWLRFPELSLERLEQRYHRITQHEYDYAAPDVEYSGILHADEYGAVTHYPQLWEQVWE